MKVVRGISNARRKFKHPVLTIGMFDGVHLAHQRIIKEVIRQAKALKGTSIVLTFSPHPLKILASYTSVPSITSLKHRVDLLKELRVDICLLVDFNKEFSKMPAQDFVKDVLVKAIGVNCLILGEGFRFGREKKGTFSLLKKLSRIYGFKVCRVEAIKMNGKIISSSRIRKVIQGGKINQANRFLGRKFSILGKVKKGSARGRILGYPTANIAPFQEIIPLAGVYAVLVKVGGEVLPGVLNIGYRPTFHAKKKFPPTIEVHIFNFQKNIYGQTIEVFFIQRIRDEKKFISRQALLARIKKDELRVKEILKNQ